MFLDWIYSGTPSPAIILFSVQKKEKCYESDRGGVDSFDGRCSINAEKDNIGLMQKYPPIF